MLFPRLIKLATEAATETKRLITSSNDIIPKSKLPALSGTLVGRFLACYGRLGGVYLEFTMSAIRRDVRLSHLDKINPKYEAIVPSIALGRLGRGECEEHAYTAAHELLKRGYCDFAICILIGTSPTKEPFEHALILMNTAGALKNKTAFSQLKNLSDDVIVLDAYLKHIGHANCYEEDMDAYLRHFSITHIVVFRPYTPHDLKMLEYVEKAVSDHLRRFAYTPYKPEVEIKGSREIVVKTKKMMIYDNRYASAYRASFFMNPDTTAWVPKSGLFTYEPEIRWEDLSYLEISASEFTPPFVKG